MRRLLFLPLLAACTKPVPPEPPAWDPTPVAPRCNADIDAPLLDDALEDANLDRDQIPFSDHDLSKASYAAVLDDAFLLPWFRDLQAQAHTLPCFITERDDALAHYADLGHPATGALTVAMGLLDEPMPDAPLDPADYIDADTELDEGLEELLDEADGDLDDFDADALPEGLAHELDPIFAAMAELIDAWQDMAELVDDPVRYSLHGHSSLMPDTDRLPNFADPPTQDWILSETGPRVLYGPTLRLAHAIETADLKPFAGSGSGWMVDLDTDMGAIAITGADAQQPEQGREFLFLLDLGGDDVWVHPAGANGPGFPLGLMIDLGGNDVYGYVEKPVASDEGRLPSDEEGRYGGDENYGPFSLSETGRQGSGRFGVGLLFDQGTGDDTYASLRMSQGWGQFGVGVLSDDGGADMYGGEIGVQGASAVGIGLLIDGGGSDTYTTYSYSQGFAYTQAVGMLYDRGGDDVYFANPGGPDDGGDPLYYTPQMAGQGNSSFSQGAGFGRRGDADGAFLSGGYGLLRDESGNDAYTASVFGQGTGYWQGLGVLSDAAGDDTYDAYYYVHGAAAHYAIGALLDGGGDDAVGQTLRPRAVHLGSGHDFSIGLFIDESGADRYRYATLGAGASNCQGIGVFADNGGDDAYEALTDYSTGLGNHSDECYSAPRWDAQAVGLFMDGGGTDTYIWPEGSAFAPPADNSSFGHVAHDHENEHGGAVDGEGETGFHVR